jgi:hypothetical protein
VRIEDEESKKKQKKPVLAERKEVDTRVAGPAFAASPE